MMLSPFDFVRIAFSILALYLGIRNPFSVRVVQRVYNYKTIILQGYRNNSARKSDEVVTTNTKKHRKKHKRKSSSDKKNNYKEEKISGGEKIYRKENEWLKSSPKQAQSITRKNAKPQSSQELSKFTIQPKQITAKISPSQLEPNKVRNNLILDFESATKPCTFIVTTDGGVVKTPYCIISFPPKCISSPLSITLTPKYHDKNLDQKSKKIFMTPELLFDSKDLMKFDPPVELEMKTPFLASNNKMPINVEIQRTEHCDPPKWQKIGHMKLNNGMIKSLCHQFCGIRSVCNACEREFMSTRIKYLLSFNDSLNLKDYERNFMLHVFTDSPEQNERIMTEMDKDRYRRIHPTQSIVLENGNNLLAYLSSPGMQCDPPLKEIKRKSKEEIFCRAVMFTMRFKGNRVFQPSDQLDIKLRITEISDVDETDIKFNCSPPPMSLNNVNVTVNGGVGLQFNYQYPCPSTSSSVQDTSHNAKTQTSCSFSSLEPSVSSTPTITKRHMSPVPLTSATPSSLSFLHTPIAHSSQNKISSSTLLHTPNLPSSLYPIHNPSAFTHFDKSHSLSQLSLCQPIVKPHSTSNHSTTSPIAVQSKSIPISNGASFEGSGNRSESVNSIDEDVLNIVKQKSIAPLKDGHWQTSCSATVSLVSGQRSSSERDSKLESGFVTQNASGLSDVNSSHFDADKVTEKLLCKDEGTQTSMSNDKREMSYSDAVKTRYRRPQPSATKPIVNVRYGKQTKQAGKIPRKGNSFFRQPWKP